MQLNMSNPFLDPDWQAGSGCGSKWVKIIRIQSDPDQQHWLITFCTAFAPIDVKLRPL